MDQQDNVVNESAPKDESVLDQIQRLATQEHELYSRDHLSDEDTERLHNIQVALDQCWDLLRQREALRNAGKNPDQAQIRPADIVENYEQ
jgi:hypothetical protein